MKKFICSALSLNAVIFICLLQTSFAQNTQSVPVGGNAFITNYSKAGNEKITNTGIENWQNKDAVFSIYIKVAQAGSLIINATYALPAEQSIIQCTVEGKSKQATLNAQTASVDLGTWNIQQPGYIKIDLQGISRTGSTFGNIKTLEITGTSVDSSTVYVKNNDDNYFYWGRRGPSVHINYDQSSFAGNAEWFYNEVTIPEGYDPVGSYFMAAGFGEGYFGIQVNSPTERRILFSVWSPFKTDDPKQIPEDKKILLLKKGQDVHAGEFGNEGSGGQSYLRYTWKAGNTYRFLLHAKPQDNNRTIYTAYFYAPEQNKWMLIASFSRPQTHTYLKHLHSFLENFDPSMGAVTRKAYYGNQWIIDSIGNKQPITKMTFTYDATAKKGYRQDYEGGVENDRFFLHNCGFFNTNTKLGSKFTRQSNQQLPVIDLKQIENL